MQGGQAGVFLRRGSPFFGGVRGAQMRVAASVIGHSPTNHARQESACPSSSISEFSPFVAFHQQNARPRISGNSHGLRGATAGLRADTEN